MKSLVAEPVFAGWVPEKPNRRVRLHNWLPIYAWNNLCEDRVDEYQTGLPRLRTIEPYSGRRTGVAPAGEIANWVGTGAQT